ncbi:HlyD family secretion protein [Cruoricaptor ignavus]|uniref:HlyD family secretion protein n=1 Tax=Cruoricaptor ignavus TaxID=1118202 RepID=A0A1M6EMQ5_9FLAO|nr:efflux RND transporter periplasmic adaptor subunit [Cruoricaptor ignavus]SHI86781.1 HlyD family secretion protein [Cruoricaptor ignavus]
MKKFLRNYWAVFIPLIILAVAVIFLIRNKRETAEASVIKITGMVEGEFVDISSSLPGRIEHLTVNVGDSVKAGQIVAQMETDKLATMRAQAQSAVVIAQSRQSKVDRGAEPEAIAAARNLQSIAEDQVELMNKTYERFQKLYEEGAISGQERDLVYFRYKAAQKEYETAKLNRERLERGSTAERREMSDALADQARNSEKLIRQLEEDAEIKSPVSGTINTLVSKQGEMVNAGYPMMTVLINDSYFINFNIRQDMMQNFQLGKKVKLYIPGANPERTEGIVTELAPALGYANYIPRNQAGQIEMRTFQIKVKPVKTGKNSGIRAGMTAELITE